MGLCFSLVLSFLAVLTVQRRLSRCFRVSKHYAFLTDAEKRETFALFEEQTAALGHGYCRCCCAVRLVPVKASGLCQKCSTLGNPTYYLDKNCLPVWWSDGAPRYFLPCCLAQLTNAEKMVIQRVSPFVPLMHIKMGVFGLSGHCVAFEQDIDQFVTVLPRKCDDVAFLKVLQTLKTECCGANGDVRVVEFKIRKSAVFQALCFLKRFNPDYGDIVIDMENLSWMKGEVDWLEGLDAAAGEVNVRGDGDPGVDNGPAPKQCVEPRGAGDDVSAFGYVDEGNRGGMSAPDREKRAAVEDALAGATGKAGIVMDWPSKGSTPVNEYGDRRIFTLAFPWLFPGGVGDVKDYPGSMNEWGKFLLFYRDGRFIQDKIFCFFAMNYIVRQRNNSSGRFFVNKFHAGCPDTLEGLKQSIRDGDLRFVTNLSFYSKRITGSSSYWVQKRSEVYAWINHHLAVGNGIPSLFITLSCAEYYWHDIVRLLRERLDIAGKDSSGCYVGSPKVSVVLLSGVRKTGWSFLTCLLCSWSRSSTITRWSCRSISRLR